LAVLQLVTAAAINITVNANTNFFIFLKVLNLYKDNPYGQTVKRRLAIFVVKES